MGLLKNILHEEITIKDGCKGHTYASIFGRAFDNSLTEITIEDPHIKEPYQIANLKDFLSIAKVNSKI